MADQALPGPVDFVLIEFPGEAVTAATAEALADLLDSGVVRLYDIALIRKGADGHSEHVDLGGSLDGAGSEFEAFAGAQSGLFDAEDIARAADALEPDATALLIAYENAWAIPFVTAAHEAGGEVVASQRIPAQVLIDALEAAEAAG
ncbi:MAG TPA: DUF6325 family protein [Jiangellaceae bacterium]